MKLVRSDSGQATVLTVLAVTALLGLAALVLDAGSWFRAQRETQAAADASALAAAQALPEEPGRSSALAAEYLAKNGGGASDVTFSSKYNTNDSVSVHVQRDAPGFFAKLFGVDSVTVGARATARAAGLDQAKYVAPIVVNVKHPKLNCGMDHGKPVPCFNETTEIELAHLHKPGNNDAAGAFGLLNLYGGSTGTAGSEELGQWIRSGYDEYMPLGIYYSVPSAKFNSTHVSSALTDRMHDVLLFPIYSKLTESGSNAEYTVIGWVGFKVTGYKLTGESGTITGQFTKVIWEGIASQSGGGMNYGARTIELIE